MYAKIPLDLAKLKLTLGLYDLQRHVVGKDLIISLDHKIT